MINGLPPRCQEFCPVAQRQDLDCYGIVLTRNCPGPATGEGEADRTTYIDRDGWLGEEEGGPLLYGKIICVNAGVNSSLRALEENR